jgi:hypothetical protein
MTPEGRSSLGFGGREQAMDDREKLSLMMEEAGPRDDHIELILRTSEDAWTVCFLDVDVEVELDPLQSRVLLSAGVGVPPEDARTHVYEAVMMYSRLWRETGGVHMALEEPGGRIVQMVALDCASLSVGTMSIVLHNLAQRTLIWRGFVEGRDQDAPPPAASDDTILRV